MRPAYQCWKCSRHFELPEPPQGGWGVVKATKYTIEVEEYGLGVNSVEVVSEEGSFALVEVVTERKSIRGAGGADGTPCEVIIEPEYRGEPGHSPGYAVIRITAADGRPRMAITEGAIRYGVLIAVAPDVGDWTREPEEGET